MLPSPNAPILTSEKLTPTVPTLWETTKRWKWREWPGSPVLSICVFARVQDGNRISQRLSTHFFARETRTFSSGDSTKRHIRSCSRFSAALWWRLWIFAVILWGFPWENVIVAAGYTRRPILSWLCKVRQIGMFSRLPHDNLGLLGNETLA